MIDRRIESIDGQAGEWFVYLRPGYAIADAGKPSAQHCFGEDTKFDIRRTMMRVQACTCRECQLAMEGAAMTPQQKRAWMRLAAKANG